MTIIGKSRVTIWRKQNKVLSILLAGGIVVLLRFGLLSRRSPGTNSAERSDRNQPMPSLTFWAINSHHGCRVDTATLLQSFNHSVIIADHPQRNSPYRAALTRPNIIFPKDNRELAPFIYSHKTFAEPVSEKDIRSFFELLSQRSIDVTRQLLSTAHSHHQFAKLICL